MRPMHAIALALMLLGAGGLGCGLYIPAKAVLAQQLLRRAWEHSAAGPARPWPWARTWPVARLEVPHLGIDQIVLAGAEGAARGSGGGSGAGRGARIGATAARRVGPAARPDVGASER